jgi:hypothetical protein
MACGTSPTARVDSSAMLPLLSVARILACSPVPVPLACAPLGAASSHVAAHPPVGESECAQGLPQSLSPPCLPYFKSFKLKKQLAGGPTSK